MDNKIEVNRIIPGDIVVVNTINKPRPMLVIKVVSDQAYAVPLSTKKSHMAFRSKAIDNSRFLRKDIVSYLHPTIHRIPVDMGAKKWIGYINPASVNKIKKQLLQYTTELLK